MTLSSRHRIRNSSPGGLRPSTLPLGHGGSPQYWLSHVDGEETFFVSFKPPRPGTEPRTLAWKAAVLTTTLGPPPSTLWNQPNVSLIWWPVPDPYGYGCLAMALGSNLGRMFVIVFVHIVCSKLTKHVAYVVLHSILCIIQKSRSHSKLIIVQDCFCRDIATTCRKRSKQYPSTVWYDILYSYTKTTDNIDPRSRAAESWNKAQFDQLWPGLADRVDPEFDVAFQL